MHARLQGDVPGDRRAMCKHVDSWNSYDHEIEREVKELPGGVGVIRALAEWRAAFASFRVAFVVRRLSVCYDADLVDFILRLVHHLPAHGFGQFCHGCNHSHSQQRLVIIQRILTS